MSEAVVRFWPKAAGQIVEVLAVRTSALPPEADITLVLLERAANDPKRTCTRYNLRHDMQHFCETSTSQLALTAMLRNFTRTLVGFVLIGFPFAVSADCVILLHGLARTSASMDKVATAFADREYAIANINYPSRKLPIEDLALLAVKKGLVACPTDGVVHFVTHSLGGILVRYYLENYEISRLGRVVMLAPPNQGSEVVNRLRKLPGFRMINGKAGGQATPMTYSLEKTGKQYVVIAAGGHGRIGSTTGDYLVAYALP